MASKAHERAQRILGNPTEAQLAEFIMHDVSALAGNAGDQGVLAYARKPVHRERPNERFLQGTIRSVAFANRKAEEDEMWNHRKRRLATSRDPPRHGDMRSKAMMSDSQSSGEDRARGSASESSGNSNRGNEAPRSAATAGMSDEQLARMLTRKRIRGRGGIGSRMDEAGPFLDPSAAADADLLEEDSRRQHARPAGPERPSWLPHSHEASPAKGEQAKQRKRRQKSEKKQKKGKKHKKDKQHKEKRRRSNEQSEAEN
ncbi:hypothetical protein CVIRNUC_007628 [Coccomyxa viridis]|uniref:Uncharacterized protein n=1 Tax=Coccomyxa viridis TaxID=1274662 RepID=A0AAV1IAM7_9CHLO|nr:hypothetical protein CVIRNUC_007628 [Coccomyxa viridis]